MRAESLPGILPALDDAAAMGRQLLNRNTLLLGMNSNGHTGSW